MRVEPFGVDSFLHVVKRGARGELIIGDELDRKRFARLLYYLNDEYRSDFWEEDVRRVAAFERPKHWPERKPLVKIVAWTLMPNHFHLLLQEIQDGGVSRFMQSLCGSMSRHFNEKYDEHGSLFQGAYRSRTIATDRYLRWAMSYVLVKNVFELYPGGYSRAIKEFDRAWKWGTEVYQHSSLKDAVSLQGSPIVDAVVIREVFKSAADFKACSQDMLLGRRGGADEAITFE